MPPRAARREGENSPEDGIPRACGARLWNDVWRPPGDPLTAAGGDVAVLPVDSIFVVCNVAPGSDVTIWVPVGGGEGVEEPHK